MTATLTPSSGLTCVPRWASPRTEGRRTFGDEIAGIAEMLGQPLMPWQRMVADVGGEIDDAGNPCYRKVIISVPRQSGKTTLVLAWECHRAIMWGRAQRIIYTAQTGNDARKKLIEDQGPALDPESAARKPISKAVKRLLKGMGNEAVEFKNGSRIVLIASGKDAGHGKTSDLAIIDEAFADTDDRREQALLPSQLTRADAQTLVLSTMGTEESVYWNRQVAIGRDAVAKGSNSGVAYFEWSADEDLDLDDPANWLSFMPALGLTQGDEAVHHARQTMTDGEFRRAMGNQSTISEERVIPLAIWNACCNESVAPRGTLTFALDANPERTGAAIVVADDSGACELIDSRSGLGWIVDACKTLCGTDRELVLDKRGPAASLGTDLESAGIKVVWYDTAEVTRACGGVYDAIADSKIRIRSNETLDKSVAGASKRQSGDAWLWARRDSNSDVSPLVALTLSYDRARQADPEPWISF